jgi:hypothetical protein
MLGCSGTSAGGLEKRRERGRKGERESPPSEAVEEEVRRGHGGRRVGIGRAITSQLLLA